MSVDDRLVMDFPSAWEFCAATQLGEHDGRCSYRLTGRGVLCDCEVLDEEYGAPGAGAGAGGMSDVSRTERSTYEALAVQVGRLGDELAGICLPENASQITKGVMTAAMSGVADLRVCLEREVTR